MSFGLGFSLPNWQPLSGAFSPFSLFVGGVQGAWYDPSDFGPSGTLFQDSAGTTPVTAVEQPVGLMLDKSQGFQRFWSGYFNRSNTELSVASNAAFTLGSSGDFTIECWVWLNGNQNNNATIVSTYLDFNTSYTNRWNLSLSTAQIRWYDSQGSIAISSTLTTYAWNHVAVVRSGSTITMYVNGNSVGTQTINQNYSTQGAVTIGRAPGIAAYLDGYVSNLRIVKGTAVYTGNFTPPSPVTGLTAISGTSLLTCQNSTFIDNSSNAFAITVTNATTTQNIPQGNHAYQTTSASRPTLRARYNLLTYSEQFDNGVWSKSGTTVSSDATTAPDSTVTADRINIGSGGGAFGIVSTISTVPASRLAFSVYLRPNVGVTWAYVRLDQGNNIFASFDIANGAVGFVDPLISSATIENVGNGWFRCTVTRTNMTAGAFFQAIFGPASSSGTTSYSSAGGNSFFAWGAQLVPTAVFPSNTYQRVGASTDYATGAAFPPYLFFDGVDDSMLTNSVDFTGTDKMLVVAGVTKLSDSAFGMVAELGNNAPAGSFWVLNGDGAVGPGPQWQFLSTGATTRAYATGTAASPISNVFTGVGDINAPLSRLRLNGAQVANTTTTQGGGNYGSYPLYIGRRNNASLPFNGNIYSLVIAGQSYTAGQISSTESWVAAKTPLGTI